MYVVASIALIALIEIIAMIFFRTWEIRSGRISDSVIDNRESAFNIFYYIHKIQHILARASVYYGNKVYIGAKKVVVRIKSVVGYRSGASKVVDLVNGKGDVDEGSGASSLYLKDITEHKDDVRKRIEEGKEKISAE